MSGKIQAACVLLLIILLAFSICALADAHEGAAPDASQGEAALRYLKSQTYDDPQAIMPGELAEAFAAAILNGFTVEADREIERLAATDLPAKDQEDIAQTLLERNIAVLERSKPLLEKGFFDFLLDTEFCDVRVASAFYALLNDQKTPEDKLRVVNFYSRTFMPYARPKMKAALAKRNIGPDHKMCWYAIVDISPLKEGEKAAEPTIAFTPPPENMPEFSNAKAGDAGKPGKYIIVRRTVGGQMKGYFMEWAMMACMPPQYLPETFDEVNRVVVVDAHTWVRGAKYRNGSQSYVPAVTIKAYDFASGKLTAKIADYKQESPAVTHTSSKEPKDFNFGLLVPDVCKKITAWLAKGSAEKVKAK